MWADRVPPRNLTTFSHVPWVLPYLNGLPSSMYHLKRVREFAHEWVTKRLQTGSKRRDLFYYLVSNSQRAHSKWLSFMSVPQNGEDQEAGAMPGQAESNGLLAILAGSDTASTAMVVLFYYLIRNPTTLDRLRDEVEKEFPAGEEPLDAAKLCQMPWLNACMCVIFPPNTS